MSKPQLDRQVRRSLAVLRHIEDVSENMAMTCRYVCIGWSAYYSLHSGSQSARDSRTRRSWLAARADRRTL